MINVTTLIFKVNFPFLDGDVPLSLHPMESISLDSIVLLEHLAMLLTSTLELRNFLIKGAKIRNRYNQVPHLIQDTNGKVTTSQLYTTNGAKRSALSQQVTTRHK